jgi:16S rRNA (guanine966-N2)-methyltransferase
MKRRSTRSKPEPSEGETVGLRIVGGQLRGSKLAYSGDLRTRPMKDRLREAVFNLVGPAVVGTHAIDLFAGTGALGLEAISRGAAGATLIERHLPTSELITQNADALGIAEQAEVLFADAFTWDRIHLPKRQAALSERPWLVFCSPPYDFYVERQADMLALIERLISAAPTDSRFIVEADERFDFGQLPRAAEWDVRTYPPAVVGLLVT